MTAINKHQSGQYDFIAINMILSNQEFSDESG